MEDRRERTAVAIFNYGNDSGGRRPASGYCSWRTDSAHVNDEIEVARANKAIRTLIKYHRYAKCKLILHHAGRAKPDNKFYESVYRCMYTACKTWICPTVGCNNFYKTNFGYKLNNMMTPLFSLSPTLMTSV